MPLAAYAGKRYGGRGIAAVALGSVLAIALLLWLARAGIGAVSVWLRPALFGIADAVLSVQVHSEWGSLGYTSGLFLSCLVVAWIASQPRPLTTMVGRRVATIWIIVPIIILPLVIEGWREDRGGGIGVSIWYSPFAALCAWLFLLGLSDTSRGLVLRSLAIATVIGVLLTMHIAPSGQGFGTQSQESTPWLQRVFGVPWSTRYELSEPVTYFALVAYFFVGDYVRKLATSDRVDTGLWRHPYLVLTALSLLWGAGFLEQALFEREQASVRFSFVGEYLALPVAGLTAGLLLRYRGVAWCIMLALVLPGAALAFGVVFEKSWSIALEAPLVAWAYGIFGIQLRSMAIEMARGGETETPFRFGAPLGRWVALLLVAGLSLVPDMLIDAEHELWQIFGKDEDIADEGAMYSALAPVVLIAAYAYGLFRLLLGAPRLLEDVSCLCRWSQTTNAWVRQALQGWLAWLKPKA